MDGGTFFFVALGAIFLFLVVGLNLVNAATAGATAKASMPAKEGFTSGSIPDQIKAVLDPMNAPSSSLCPIYGNIRQMLTQNEIAINRVSEKEAASRVEKTLAMKIPGGALQCPFLTYPADTATDDEWIDFLTRVPSDFGARVIFMAMYAKKELNRRAANVRAGLKGGKVTSDAEFNKMDEDSGNSLYEDFTVLPPTLRPVEHWADADADEDDNPDETPEQKLQKKRQKKVTSLLENLQKTRTKTLQDKGVSASIDINPILAAAKQSNDYTVSMKAKAEDGSIVNEVDLPA